MIPAADQYIILYDSICQDAKYAATKCMRIQRSAYFECAIDIVMNAFGSFVPISDTFINTLRIFVS